MSLMRKLFPPFLLFIVPAGFWLLLLLGFWPGLMTYDSIVQWGQVARFQFFDWHPFFHTFLMWIITRAWNTPGAVAVVQVILYSAAVAYTLNVFQDYYIPRLVIAGVCLFFSLFLLNGLLAITLWKDIPYSIAMLLVTVFILRIITSNGEWIESYAHWVLLGLFSALVALFRHNGLPESIGILSVLALVYKSRWKSFAAAVAVFIGLYMFVQGPVAWWLEVDRENTQGPGVVFIHPIAAHVDAGAEFTAEEADFLNRIYPLDDGWSYSCFDATVLFYRGVSFTPVNDEPFKAARLLWKLTLQRPLVTLKHYYCVSSFLWKLPQADGVYLETVVLANRDASSMPGYQEYTGITRTRPKLPAVNQAATQVYQAVYNFDQRKILFRPAFYTYLFGAAVIWTGIRRKSWKYLLLLLPIGIHSGFLAVSIHLQAVRYQYPAFITSMLFTVPLLFLPQPALSEEQAQAEVGAISTG